MSTAAPGPIPHAPAAPPSPGSDAVADLSAALPWAWKALVSNLAAFLVSGGVYGVVTLVLLGLGIAGCIWGGISIGIASPEPQDASDLAPLLYGVLALLGAAPLAGVVSMLWGAGAARAAATVSRGRRPSIGEALVGTGPIFATALLVGAGTFVGMLLLYVPGLIFSFLCMWAIPAAANGAGPVDAIKESVSLVRSHLAASLLTLLVVAAAASIAGIVLLAIVVLPPFAALFIRAMHERVSGRQLVPPAADAPRAAP